MNVAQLWSLDTDLVVVEQWNEAAIFLARLYVAETDHVDFEGWAADGQKPISQVTLLFCLVVTCNALLHAFRGAVLDDWKSETDLLFGKDPTNRVLPDFVFAERIGGDDIGDVGDVAVLKLIVASLDS